MVENIARSSSRGGFGPPDDDTHVNPANDGDVNVNVPVQAEQGFVDSFSDNLVDARPFRNHMGTTTEYIFAGETVTATVTTTLVISTLPHEMITIHDTTTGTFERHKHIGTATATSMRLCSCAVIGVEGSALTISALTMTVTFCALSAWVAVWFLSMSILRG